MLKSVFDILRRQSALNPGAVVPAGCFRPCDDAFREAQIQGKVPELCAGGSAFTARLDTCLDCIESDRGNTTVSSSRESLSQEFVDYLRYCDYQVFSTLVYTSTDGKVMTAVIIAGRPGGSVTHASTTSSSNSSTSSSGTISMTSTSSTSSNLPTGTPGPRDEASDARDSNQARTIGIAVGATVAGMLLIVATAAVIFIKARSRKRKENSKNTDADSNNFDKPMLHSDHIPRPNPHEVEGSPAAGELGDFVPYFPAELPAREVPAHEMPGGTPWQK